MENLNEIVHKFIKEVEKYKELYDKTHKYFNHSVRKESIWKALSAKYKINAKVKWTYLRERFSREKKKSNNSEVYRSSWHLYPYLSFLEKHVKQRDRRTTKWNFQPPEKCNDNLNDPMENQKDIKEMFSPYHLEGDCSERKAALPWSDEELELTDVTNDSHNNTSFHKENLSNVEIPFTEFLNFTPTETRKRKFIKEESFGRIQSEVAHKMNHNSNDDDDDDNEDWHFLQSLKYKMRKMRDEEKTQFKIEMLLQAEKATLNSKRIPNNKSLTC